MLEPLAKVFRVFFDPRFEQLAARLEGRISDLETAGAQTREESRAMGEAVAEVLTFLNRSIRESSAAMSEVNAQVASLREPLREVRSELEEVKSELEEVRRHVTAVPEGLALLGQRDAILLNHAESHAGFGAEKGLWFNPPVTLRYEAGNVELADINERIVEMPFVFEKMSDLALGARVLDVGCAESTVAFSLASLGYEVTGIDLHPYPFQHPNLRTVASAVEEWDCPDSHFDGIVCLSSIEHFGLGVYGEEETEGLDILAMERITRWAKPGAILALTTPFGPYRVNAQQRTYDMHALERLLEGWDVTDLHTAVRLDDGQGWQVVDGERSFDEGMEAQHPAVVLVGAQKASG